MLAPSGPQAVQSGTKAGQGRSGANAADPPAEAEENAAEQGTPFQAGHDLVDEEIDADGTAQLANCRIKVSAIRRILDSNDYSGRIFAASGSALWCV